MATLRLNTVNDTPPRKPEIISTAWLEENAAANWQAHVALIPASTAPDQSFQEAIATLHQHGVRQYVFVGSHAEEAHDNADDILFEQTSTPHPITVFYTEDELEEALFWFTNLAWYDNVASQGMLAVLNPDFLYDEHVRKSLSDC